MNIWMGADQTDTEPMIISNDGPGSLNYNISVLPVIRGGSGVFDQLLANGQVEPAWRTYPEGFHEYTEEKGADDPREGYPVERNAGGPDVYGYYWIDSDEPGGPMFNWIDITTTGTDVVAQLDDDNYIGPFSLGFGFQFYDSLYTQVYIGSNGIIGFKPDAMNARAKTVLPKASTPNSLIAWLWDDLDVTDNDNTNAHCYIQSFADKFVVSFIDYPEYSAAAGDVVTAQVILGVDGSITYQYQTIAAGFDVANCSIGIENETGTDGLQVAYLTSYLKNNLAVKFVAPHRWLMLDKFSGSLAAGAADTITCSFSSEGMENGTYLTNVIVRSNDPDAAENPWTVPFELTISEEQPWVCGDVAGDGVGPNVADLTYFVAYLFSGGPTPPVIEAADMNGSGGGLNVVDLNHLVAYLFTGGPAPTCGL